MDRRHGACLQRGDGGCSRGPAAPVESMSQHIYRSSPHRKGSDLVELSRRAPTAGAQEAPSAPAILLAVYDLHILLANESFSELFRVRGWPIEGQHLAEVVRIPDLVPEALRVLATRKPRSGLSYTIGEGKDSRRVRVSLERLPATGPLEDALLMALFEEVGPDPRTPPTDLGEIGAEATRASEIIARAQAEAAAAVLVERARMEAQELRRVTAAPVAATPIVTAAPVTEPARADAWLGEARSEAERIRRDAAEDAARIRAAAGADAERIRSEASQEVERTVQAAREDASRSLELAREEARALTGPAAEHARRTVEDARAEALALRDAIAGQVIEVSSSRIAALGTDEGRMELVARLVHTIATEFNNQLNIIGGYSGLIGSRLAADSPLRPIVGKLKAAVEKAAGLTRQLLDIVPHRGEAPRSTEVGPLIARVVATVSRLLGPTTPVEGRAAEALEAVRAEPWLLEQAAVHVALRISEGLMSGGTIHIEATGVHGTPSHAPGPLPPGRYVLISIGRQGKAEACLTLAPVLEPFLATRDPGRPVAPGLATVQSVVERCGGFVTVTSDPGESAAIRLYLRPISEPDGPPGDP